MVEGAGCWTDEAEQLGVSNAHLFTAYMLAWCEKFLAVVHISSAGTLSRGADPLGRLTTRVNTRRVLERWFALMSADHSSAAELTLCCEHCQLHHAVPAQRNATGSQIEAHIAYINTAGGVPALLRFAGHQLVAFTCELVTLP